MIGYRDTLDWYNANAEKYSRVTIPLSSMEQIERFRKFLKEGDKILDVGSGSGRDTFELNRLGYPTTGVDMASGLVKEARKNFPGLTFVEGDMLNLPLENESFNAIWAHACLVHFETVEEVARALSEFNRVLKPEGVLFVSVKAQTGINKTEVVADTLSNHDRFFRYFTKPELRELLANAGFKVLTLDQENETATNPKGRPEVEWITAISRK